MNAKEHYQAGKLNDAVTAALEDVKKNPTDAGKRGFLCELLCLSGDLERADRQLDMVAQQGMEAGIEVVQFRQLLRAEEARQQFFKEGRLPEFINQDITPNLQKHLEASILIREGKGAEAAALLTKVAEETPPITGTRDGQPFEGLRDLDDLTACFFEVFATTGKYYWIPFQLVESLELHDLETPRDLMWRGAHMSLRGGPDGDVFLPVLYTGSAADADDQVRLGRLTDWRGEAGARIRGFGQRMFLVGDQEHSILEIKALTINPA